MNISLKTQEKQEYLKIVLENHFINKINE